MTFPTFNTILHTVNTLQTLLIFECCDYALMPYLHNFSIYDEIKDMGLITYVGSTLALFFLYDMHAYFTHRLLHCRVLYDSIHHEHHTEYSALNTFSISPVEAIILYSVTPITLCLIPVHLKTLQYFSWFMRGLAVFNHTVSESHREHHCDGDCNYGQTPLWDLLLGTNRSKKPNIKQKGATVTKSGVTGTTLCAYASSYENATPS